MMEDKKYIKFDIPEWVNWLARDKSGALYGYRLMPIRCYDIWGSGEYVNDTSNSILITEDPNHFPQVKWGDEEPLEYRGGI